MRKQLLIGVLTLASLVSVPVVAGTIELGWDAVPGATGYRVHYGRTTEAYQQVVDVGSSRVHTLRDLSDCTTYFIAVKAYDGQGNQSADYSNEIVGWSRPEFDSVGAIQVRQGDQLSLDIRGANFESGATVTLDSATVPRDQQGNPLIRVENLQVAACDRLQALITVETTARGFRAAELGQFPFDLLVRNRDDVFGASTRTLQVSYAQQRSDINRSNNSTRDRVDGKDLIWLARAHGAREGQSLYNPDADLDGDGIVDGQDLALMSPHFGGCWTGSGWSIAACD